MTRTERDRLKITAKICLAGSGPGPDGEPMFPELGMHPESGFDICMVSFFEIEEEAKKHYEEYLDDLMMEDIERMLSDDEEDY